MRYFSPLLMNLTLMCLLISSANNGWAQQLPGAERIMASYTKSEVRISMRDGTTLFTAIYAPIDQSEQYPILISRTPYGCPPYGEDRYNPVSYTHLTLPTKA